MKKLLTLVAAFFIGINILCASPVDMKTAQKVAQNFFGGVSSATVSSISLAYTETDGSGNAVYYVFNINGTGGFVIVSADDILHPIIGYSTEKRAYAIPVKGSNINYWMQKRKAEIIQNVTNKVSATIDITNEWTSYINNVPVTRSTKRVTSSAFPSSTVYLVQSTWDQESPYWDDCPGPDTNRSVTGCVATAMNQIMRFWQYPATGQSSSSYNAYGYGILSAKYNHAYPWSSMPLVAPSTTDTALARSMSDAGISVEMGYSPTGSGAWVITSDDPKACAQIAYVKYFKYYSKIIDGLNEFGDATAWQDTLQHELDCGRPVEYVGSDPVEGGHTWVCDGYDASSNFHMNWGWSGLDNGWYALNNLNPNTLNFSQNIEALIGIMPPPAAAKPVAHFTSSSKKTCTGETILFADTSSNQPINWNWTFTGGSPATSTMQDPTVSYSSPGTYAVKLVVSNSFGSDSVISTTYVTINATPAAPTITQTNDTLTCVPSNYVSYQWYKSNVAISGATSYRYIMSKTGLYKVEFTDSSGCSNSGVLLVRALGINEISLNDYIKVYPNPGNGNFQVLFDMPSEDDYQLAVTNMLGQTVYSHEIHISGESVQNINLSGCSKGMYFLVLNGKNSRGVQKLIIN